MTAWQRPHALPVNSTHVKIILSKRDQIAFPKRTVVPSLRLVHLAHCDAAARSRTLRLLGKQDEELPLEQLAGFTNALFRISWRRWEMVIFEKCLKGWLSSIAEKRAGLFQHTNSRGNVCPGINSTPVVRYFWRRLRRLNDATMNEYRGERPEHLHGVSCDLSNMIGGPGGVRPGLSVLLPMLLTRPTVPIRRVLYQCDDPTAVTSAHSTPLPGRRFLFLRRLALDRKSIVRDEEHCMELIANGFDIIEVARRPYHLFDRDQCLAFVHQTLISAEHGLPLRLKFPTWNTLEFCSGRFRLLFSMHRSSSRQPSFFLLFSVSSL